jgi:hypothetical protein
MWIIFGTDVKTTRVPGGARAERHCDQCGESATFYEKEVKATFQLYFLPIFDYRRHRVMACGCCGACYATDELGAPASHEEAPARRLGEGIDRAAQKVGGALGRAADAIEAGVSGLFSDENASVRGRAPQREEEQVARDVEDESDPLADPLEARFRELERKARVRIK